MHEKLMDIRLIFNFPLFQIHKSYHLTEDDILELLHIYNQLKAQIKYEEVTEGETLELFSETKKLLVKLFQKLKEEVEENEGKEA